MEDYYKSVKSLTWITAYTKPLIDKDSIDIVAISFNVSEKYYQGNWFFFTANSPASKDIQLFWRPKNNEHKKPRIFSGPMSSVGKLYFYAHR